MEFYLCTFWALQFIWLWDNLQLQLQHQLGQDCELGGASLKASNQKTLGQNQMCKGTVKSIDSYFKQHECECQKSKTNM